MSSVGMGFGCLVLGGGTLVNWWFEMFSDCGYAQLCRSIMSQGGFYLGRNTIALIEPAVGSMFAFGGALLLVETSGSEISLPEAFFGGGLFLSMLLFAVGLIPFRLPAPMYPEWQMERRRRRAERGGNRARAGGRAADEAARAVWDASAPPDGSEAHGQRLDSDTRTARQSDRQVDEGGWRAP